MPGDTAYLYATARIRALEPSLLTGERCQRLADAAGEDDVARVLSECGYDTARPMEAMLHEALADAFALTAELSPDGALSDFFRIKYDYHNIKVWIKSERLDALDESLLSPLGRVPVDRFLDAARALRYQDLPPGMRNALTQARELLARTGDAQLSDMHLDRAMFAEMLDTARRTEDDFLIRYARLLIDAVNLRVVTRAPRMDCDVDFIAEALLRGGCVDVDRLTACLRSGSELAELYRTGPLEQAARLSEAVRADGATLTAFERACENALIGFLRAARYVSFGPAPLITYLAARESEQPIVRALMAGRRAGLSREELMSRVRETCY